MRSLLSTSFCWLLTSQLAFGIAFSATLLVPRFVAEVLGGSPADVGRVAACFTLSMVAVFPLVGRAVDRYGRRRFMATGALGMALAGLGLAGVEAIGAGLLGLRLLAGVSFALFFVAGSTLAADLAPRERLGQAVALYAVVLVATQALGPALAETLVEAAGWRAVFSGIGAFAVVSGGLVAMLPATPRPPAAASASWRAIASSPGARTSLCVALLGGICFAAMITFVPARAGAGEASGVARFFVFYAAAAVATRVGAGSLLDGAARRPTAIFAAAVYALAPLALSWLERPSLALVGAAFGGAHGLLYPALNALLIEKVDPRARGRATALFHASFNLGWAAGALGLGQIAARLGYSAAYEAAAVAFAPAVVLLCLEATRDAHSSPAPPAGGAGEAARLLPRE